MAAATASLGLAAISSAATPQPVTSTTAPTTTTTTTTPPTTTTTPTTTTPTTTTTTPPPARRPIRAVKASATLYLPDAFFVHRRALTVPGRLLQVGGVVHPFSPGQSVEVRAYVGHRLIKTDRLAIKPSRNRRYGRFMEKLESPSAGLVTIEVTHERTPRMLGFLAQRRIAALDVHVGFGSTGPFVALIQQRLQSLHFYLPQSGVYDAHTGLAVDAYHRLLGRGTSQTLDATTISYLLEGRGSFRVRYPQDGTHAEGNLSKQLLALVYGSRVYRIYPISSGKPSTPTILGRFHVYYRVPRYLPDGMYFSSFFYNGYAIHGFDPAPDYPASHGCMRLPITDALSVFHWINYGDGVDVYL